MDWLDDMQNEARKTCSPKVVANNFIVEDINGAETVEGDDANEIELGDEDEGEVDDEGGVGDEDELGNEHGRTEEGEEDENFCGALEQKLKPQNKKHGDEDADENGEKSSGPSNKKVKFQKIQAKGVAMKKAEKNAAKKKNKPATRPRQVVNYKE